MAEKEINFSLDEVEVAAANEFQEEHKGCYAPVGVSGSCKFTYLFTPTGIGMGKAIQCNVCKVHKNITNYDNW